MFRSQRVMSTKLADAAEQRKKRIEKTIGERQEDTDKADEAVDKMIKRSIDQHGA
jgi:C-terminal processing protease CtpA/Prc